MTARRRISFSQKRRNNISHGLINIDTVVWSPSLDLALASSKLCGVSCLLLDLICCLLFELPNPRVPLGRFSFSFFFVLCCPPTFLFNICENAATTFLKWCQRCCCVLLSFVSVASTGTQDLQNCGWCLLGYSITFLCLFAVESASASYLFSFNKLNWFAQQRHKFSMLCVHLSYSASFILAYFFYLTVQMWYFYACTVTVVYNMLSFFDRFTRTCLGASTAVVRRRPFPLSYAAMFPLLRQAVIKDLLNSSGVHPVNNCSLLTYRDSYYFVEWSLAISCLPEFFPFHKYIHGGQIYGATNEAFNRYVCRLFNTIPLEQWVEETFDCRDEIIIIFQFLWYASSFR